MQKYLYKIGTAYTRAENELNSFDRALLGAGVGNYNLLKISSILPVNAERIDKIVYEEGALLPVAYAKFIVSPALENGSLSISAAVAIGVPTNQDKVGVIMKWAGYGNKNDAKTNVVSMVKVAMEDRGISNYEIVLEAVEGERTENEYACVFACVALMSSIRV